MSESNELLTKKSGYKSKSYPESPFTRAKEEWNDRTGSLIKNARSWRMQALCGYLLAAGAMGALTYKSLQSSIQPYYIRVAENGQPLVIGPLPENFSPAFNEIRYFLTEEIELIRGIPLDPVLVKKNYKKAISRMGQGAINKLNDWAQKEPRLANVGSETVSIQVLGVVPISGTSSYQARWTEEHRDSKGILKERQTWNANFTVEILLPKTDKELIVNPIGLLIKDYQWTREI